MASHLDRRPVGILPCHPIDLRTEHLPQALELSQALRWPYRLEDWAFAHQLGRGFAVEIEGRLAGTALWWPYGDRHASAGMVIVSAQDQRKGIGGMLMDALLGDAAGRTVLLNSTEDGLGLYTRLGFIAHGHVIQHQGVLAQAPSPASGESVRSLAPGDLTAVRDLDLGATGMDRTRLIDALLSTSEVKVIDRGGRISGYACVRTWGRGVVIGPVVAADDSDARALIAALAAPHVGRFVRIDLPAAVGLSPWVESIGLPRVDKVVAMALGELPKPAVGAKLFALSNQSLG